MTNPLLQRMLILRYITLLTALLPV
jgi:hypothetical protein